MLIFMMHILTSTDNGFLSKTTCDLLKIKKPDIINLNNTQDDKGIFLVHLCENIIVPFNSNQSGYIFTVYYHHDKNINSYKNSYTDTQSMRFKFVPVTDLIQALNLISESIINTQKQNMDVVEENMVAFMLNTSWNTQCLNYINRQLKQKNQTLSCFDIYRYMGIVNKSKLADVIKSMLQTDKVFPDDPIAFAYSVMIALNGARL